MGLNRHEPRITESNQPSCRRIGWCCELTLYAIQIVLLYRVCAVEYRMYFSFFGFGGSRIFCFLLRYSSLLSRMPGDYFSLGGEYFTDTAINGQHLE